MASDGVPDHAAAPSLEPSRGIVEDPAVVATATSIGRRAARGGLAFAGRTITVQMMQVVSSLLIAKLLLPSDYGAIALGTTIVALARYLGDFGASNVVIQAPGEKAMERGVLSAAFFLQLVSSVLATLLFVVAAPWITRAFNGPSATTLVIDVIALTLIVNAFAAVPRIRLMRAMRFERVGLIQLVALACQYVVQIGALVAGAGLWALVAGSVVQSIVEATLMLAAGGGTVAPHPRGSGKLIRPGLAYQVSGMLIAVTNIAAVAIFGRMKGASALGLLTWSTVLATPLITLSQNFAWIGFPAFSRLEEHHRHRRERAGELVVRVLLLGLAAAVGVLGGLAEPVIQLVFDPKWLRALDAVRFSLIGALPMALALFLGVMVESSGRPKERMWVKTTASIVGIGALVPFGRWWGVAGGAAALYLLLPCVEALLISRRAGTPTTRGIMDGVLTGGCSWAGAWALAPHAQTIPRLIAVGALAGGFALVVMLLVDRRAVTEALNLALPADRRLGARRR